MTDVAERNQVLFDVATGVATKVPVMNLKVLRAAAVLASPVVTLEDLEAQPMVGV
jgi:hypothetical protein